MKYTYKLIVCGLLSAWTVLSNAQVTNLQNSPYNMQNSQFNMENSSYNMRNSPYNMENSPYNLNSNNGIYDNNGNRMGYEVKAPSGVTNYFDNNGNRIGYTPSNR